MLGNGASISTERGWCQVEDALRNRVTVYYVLFVCPLQWLLDCRNRGPGKADLPAELLHTFD